MSVWPLCTATPPLLTVSVSLITGSRSVAVTELLSVSLVAQFRVPVFWIVVPLTLVLSAILAVKVKVTVPLASTLALVMLPKLAVMTPPARFSVAAPSAVTLAPNVTVPSWMLVRKDGSVSVKVTLLIRPSGRVSVKV